MPLLTRFIGGIRALFHRRQLESELDEELRAYLDIAIERKVAAGMSRIDALRAARVEIGSVEAVKDRVRDAGWESLVETFWQDVRYALRTLKRSPSFTAVAVTTLALGIGATTAIFSVVDTILLEPLPFSQADRLVHVVENVPPRVTGGPPVQRGMSYLDFLEWRTRTRTLSDPVAVAVNFGRIVKTTEGTARLWSAMVSPETFDMLGSRAMLGRTLDASDAANPDVAVLSFAAWQRVFHSDPRVVGTTIEFGWDWGVDEPDRRLVTIVGVLPAAFEFPSPSFAPSTGIEVYTPFVDDVIKRFPIVTVMGHLRSGVSLGAARDEADIIGSAIRSPLPVNAPAMTVPRFDVEIVQARVVQRLRPALRVFLAAVAFVLLIVCANVANLLLARGTVRQGEIALRLAIGASRARIVRQMLTECLVLAVAGGALGGLFAAAGLTLVKELASVEAPGIFQLAFATSLLPRVHEIDINLRMFGVAFGIAATTSVVFGILPALHLSRAPHLDASASRIGSNRRESRTRAALVVGQFVMATVLLVSAGLLTTSFIKLATTEKGYDPSNLLVFQLLLPDDYTVARKADTIEAILTRLRATPSVEGTGFARHGVLMPEAIRVGTFVPRGRTLDDMRADPARPNLQPVSDGYLAAMGVRLLAGREFAPTDSATSTPVIVISRSVARRFFGATSPIGQFVDWYVGDGPAFSVQVVGVVEDIRNQSPDCEACPDIYVDYRQLLALEQRWGDSPRRQAHMPFGYLSFAVRSRGNSTSIVSAVRRIVQTVDPNAGVDAMIPMDRLVASSIARPRFYAVLLGVFAGVAALLAAIGIYGVLAYAVTQRTKEIGIRMALGAERRQVLALVLRRGMTLAIIGIALGLVGAAIGARFLQGMLFGVTPLDARTFVGVSLAFGFVAALASYVPARRATHVDPMVALRSE